MGTVFHLLPIAAASQAGSWITAAIIAAIIIILAIRNIRIVPQATNFIIERLGAYQTTWPTGIHIKIPVIERVAKIVSLKEKVADFQPQAVITKDNVTMQIDTVLFYQITNPKLYAYGIENPIIAMENLSATTLRNLIGDLELDETLTSRDLINTRMRLILDEATDHWGIKVNRVELRNIIPPKEIQIAMERQMKAEREKRESILRAEGEREAAIRVAEGEKTSAILRAEANKEAAIREAEGQATAILKIQEATAQGLLMIKNVGADQPLIALKSLETLAQVADGRATKIIIPSEIQNLAGLLTSIKEVTAADPPTDA
ncbi:MAG TPA: peptidase [Clostridiales bacterium]|nr:peptidase [Clostridiales bacterium]